MDIVLFLNQEINNTFGNPGMSQSQIESEVAEIISLENSGDEFS